MEPVSIALALAKVAGLDTWIQEKISGTVTEKVAGKIIDVAKVVTGEQSGEEALALVKENPSLATELNAQLMQNEHELKLAAYADREDARRMYRQHPQQANKLAAHIMRYNLPFIVFLVIVNCVVLHFFREHAALLAAISNVLGMAIKSLFDERKEVTGFYFGGSMDASEPRKTDG